MSVSVQRLGTFSPHWKTSALKRQARRELPRRLDAGRERPCPVTVCFRGSAAFSTCSCGTGCSACFCCTSAILIHSVSARREACGTSAKRMPTRPEASCQTTSPESRIGDRFAGRLNWKYTLQRCGNRRCDCIERPLSLRSSTVAGTSSLFAYEMAAGACKATRRLARFSLCIRPRAARRLLSARSTVTGLYTTKFALLAKTSRTCSRPSTRPTIRVLLLRGTLRMAVMS